MEVAIGSNGSTPFQREVREWQRVDPNTGALLTGRLEADRWINGPLNAYGKVVDSQNVSKPNGTQHTQRKQLEVLQARTSSGSLQVVRAQTVQTTSSRWSSGIRGAASSAFDSGSKFTNGGLHLTNGHASDINDDHLTNPINSNLLTAPSLKLSTLMKSSNATNGDRTSPHSVTNSMSLVQRHQQHFKQQQQQQQKHETEIQSNLTDARYQPTLGEVRVGGGSVEQMGLFRNERETADANKLPHLQRGRSVSTDDLSTDRDNEDGEDPSEWRRVSKIRRSFQFPKSTSPKPIPTRPLDLPENSVSVSRIRQELENGRRLNTAMRNNHVDLAALDSILNGSLETAESKSTKKTSFLTAESLKEIRGKLKKLSDESLYKDDFIMQGDRDKETEKETSSSSAESRLHVQHQMVLKDSQLVHQPAFQYHPKTEAVHTTNSLENRTRYRDTTSAEWHLRRKSYGFEKMSPQDSSMFRLETSTDSGIGRSGDLTQWSPTETTPRSTVITLGEKVTPVKATVTLVNGHESAASTVPKPVVHRRFLAKTIESTESSEVKRHSIAVDESKYVRDNLRKVFDAKTSVHLNGLYMKESNSSQTSINDENGRRQKRVEFCKTEVHFAAESGRVNIVETDGKPPPTNNFRRRRRSSGSSIGSAYLEAINSGLPVIHFGDEKKTVFEQEMAIEESPVSLRNNVTVSVPTAPEGVISKIMQDEEDDGSDEISLRGILKNKPIKPKPYHLGENIDSSDSLWGVRLKPVATTDLLSVKPSSFDPIQERTPIDNNRLEPVTENKEATTIASLKSVAERIRIVEERKDGSGYSTKINLNLSNSPYSWTSPDTDNHQEHIKPISLRLDDNNTSVKPSSSSIYPIIRPIPQHESSTDGLKSTSLIMRTMKSATQFDEALKRLQSVDTAPAAASTASTATATTSASKMISNLQTITKSNSANSIFREPERHYRPKYTSSLDGDIVLNDEVSSTSWKTSSSSSFNSTSSSSFLYDKIGSSEPPRIMEPLKEEPSSIHEDIVKVPIATPRIKVIGSSNAVSHQLSQLRRLYDASGNESDDSAKADEEVKRYLGGNCYSSSDDRTSESSGSWSRIKAQRHIKRQSQEEIKEAVKSNITSISLHSPTKNLIAPTTSTTTSSITLPSNNEVPVAKPRTLPTIKTPRSVHSEMSEINKTFHTETVRTAASHKIETNKTKEPLKIAAGGARKLRDHELSYFGVKVTNGETKLKSQQRTSSTTNNNNETNRKLTSSSTNGMEFSTKWKLTSDKPDLLRHSPVTDGKNAVQESVLPKASASDGPIYENLKKPSSYNRKKDLQRDEMILSEMTKDADQTLEAVSTEIFHRDQQRRTTPQRTTQPLDTIDEKVPTHHQPQQKSMKSKAIQVSRPGGESFQRPCCSSGRPSSASSTESLTRLSSSGSIKVTKSGSKDTKDKIEYANVRATRKVTPTPPRECSKSHQRSSSRDTQRTRASSSEDLPSTQKAELVRRTKRSKTRESESSTSRVDERSRTSRTSAERDDKHKSVSRSTHDHSKSSRRPAKSDKVERVDKVSSVRSKGSSTITQDYQQKSSRNKATSGHLTSTTSSSSKRVSKDHIRK